MASRGASHPLVAVYADESCLGNGREGDNPGGAAGVVEALHPRTGRIVRRDYWISEPATTNNRMALRSVIEAFRGLSPKGGRFSVVFTSDSRYLIDGLRDWVLRWDARGWTRKGGAIENLRLWQDAVAAIRSGAREYEWRWVRGHAGHAQNEYANYLAMRAAAGQSSSSGFVASGFDEWLATPPGRGIRRAPHTAEPFPDAAAFVAAPALPAPPASALPTPSHGRREG